MPERPARHTMDGEHMPSPAPEVSGERLGIGCGTVGFLGHPWVSSSLVAAGEHARGNDPAPGDEQHAPVVALEGGTIEAGVLADKHGLGSRGKGMDAVLRVAGLGRPGGHFAELVSAYAALTVSRFAYSASSNSLTEAFSVSSEKFLHSLSLNSFMLNV